MSRTKKSVINSAVGIACTLISGLLSFILQSLFIRLLGLEYSGINGLFTDVMKILNLAELGITNAILFRLYKHIAENNQYEIEKILNYYRKVCYLIGFIILAVGLCFVPFLKYFVKEEPAFPESLWSLYLIVLATSVITQFYNYKAILIIAKQDRYIHTIITYSTIFFKHALQIFVLWVFKNIYLYLLVALATSIINGIVTGVISMRRYNHKYVSNESLNKNEKRELIKDIGSLSVYKFCRTIDASIDTFLIGKFVNISQIAIYGSINMLLAAITDMLGQFNDGMIAGVGDLYASKRSARIEKVFYESVHFTFLIHGICVAVLVPFISPFLNWWIGYTFSDGIIYMMLLNFFLNGMSGNISTFRNSMGLFRKGWKQPAATVVLNIIFSILLVKRMGIIGTIIGTFLARALTIVWFDPYVVCKYGLNKKPVGYYVRYLIYCIITLLVSNVTYLISCVLPTPDTFILLFLYGVLYLFTSLFLFVLLGCVFKEQKTVFNRVLLIVKDVSKILLKSKFK